MESFTRVAQLSALPQGEMIAVEVNGQSVLIANVNGEIHAVSEICTHADGPLSEGYLDAQYVECPWHSSIFNVVDGSVDGPPASDALRVYATRIEGDTILVGPPLP